MEIKEAVKKVNRLNALIKEHTMLYALTRSMEKVKRETGIEFDMPYMNNICKIILDIEEKFDNFLKD